MSRALAKKEAQQQQLQQQQQQVQRDRYIEEEERHASASASVSPSHIPMFSLLPQSSISIPLIPPCAFLLHGFLIFSVPGRSQPQYLRRFEWCLFFQVPQNNTQQSRWLES